MALFDITMIMIFTISSICGFFAGIVKLSLKFISFATSIFLAYFFQPFINNLLYEYFQNPLLNNISSYIISYIISLIFCSLLTTQLISFLSVIRGGWIDRSIGMIVGSIRGFAFNIIIYLFVIIFLSSSYLEAKNINELIINANEFKHVKWLEKSFTKKYLDITIKELLTIIPENISNYEIYKNKKAIKKHDDKIKDENLETKLRNELKELL